MRKPERRWGRSPQQRLTTRTRREFLGHALAGTAALAAPWLWSPAASGSELLPRRPIPGSDASLPVIGLGNSNAFRNADLPASTELVRLFHERGGAYVDCSGQSRFVVAEVAGNLDIGSELFLGSYFSDADESAMRENIARLLALTGKKRLDLVHAYPEFAVPNWNMFRRWKDEGLTRFIGVARHQERFYESMMQLMRTGTVDFLQVNYSPLETAADQAILPLAQELGVAVTINRPFVNGAYFGRVRGRELPEWAAEFDCASWAQFSLKFILAHPAVTCVLTETANPAHAEDNIGAGFGRLPDERTRRRIVEYLREL